MKNWSWHFISDVHIKEPGDKSEELLLNFLKKSVSSSECEKVFLCGDIFDLMVGNFNEYLKKYQKVFMVMCEVLAAGKDLYFIEGNHDFNIEKLLKNEFLDKAGNKGKFYFSNEFFFLTKDQVKYLICHGDTIEIEAGSYPLYKKIITSRFIKMLIENNISYNFLEKVGTFASRRSRERGTKAYGISYNDEKIKDKFRKSVIKLSESFDFNVLICGHSHVKDYIHLGEHIRYVNNGYAPVSQTYIRVQQGKITFESLIDE